MVKKPPITFPELLGNSLAFVQVKLDDAFHFLFKGASKLGKTKVRQQDHFAKKLVFRTFGFIGDIGNSFYREYRNLKKGKN